MSTLLHVVVVLHLKKDITELEHFEVGTTGVSLGGRGNCRESIDTVSGAMWFVDSEAEHTVHVRRVMVCLEEVHTPFLTRRPGPRGPMFGGGKR